jgi:hypothetical protein
MPAVNSSLILIPIFVLGGSEQRNARQTGPLASGPYKRELCVTDIGPSSLSLSLDKEREQSGSSELSKVLSDKDKVLSDKERWIQIGIVAAVQSFLQRGGVLFSAFFLNALAPLLGGEGQAEGVAREATAA